MNPCGHITPDGGFGGDFDLGAPQQQWAPCWQPQVFLGEFDLHIMPRRVEMTIQGFNFHGGMNCMNLFLIPAKKGTCQAVSGDFADPYELSKGQICDPEETATNRE